jgi:hypothetical protein
MVLKTPCDTDVFFTLPHGDTLQTSFDLSLPPLSPPLEMDTVSQVCLKTRLIINVSKHQAFHGIVRHQIDPLNYTEISR